MKGTDIINAFSALSCTVTVLGRIRYVMKGTNIINAFLAFSCTVRKNKVRHGRH